ncbi:MAG TPA: adenylate/guanylate cyclase domain-containing protein [Pyrinomonadaceae bacterium]|nr:adenylate/guanylate cyclase domain-containing protein [Pyrinomonadaceae bacterium]
MTLLQTTTYLVVRRANRQHALAQIDSSLQAGAQIFEKLIEQRNRQITGAASILSRDHAFQEAFAGADQDRATTLSALESLQGRVKADVVLIASLEKELLFDMRRPDLHGVAFPFPRLIDKAEKNESAYAFVILDNVLYAMAVTPLLAPDPIAWLCPGFRIDDDFAREIKSYANLEITFFGGQNFFATTFDEKKRPSLMRRLNRSALPPKKIVDLGVAGETFLSYAVPLPTDNGNAIALLQRSLDLELAPHLRLEHTYLFLALLGLTVSAALGVWIGRGVSSPVLQLAESAQKIAAGDYQHRVDLKQEDEIGSLADSFNQMSEGLAERDRVRDLLGKVVSPEVAAELLRKDVVLGGEEREVTVLFSDLRDFTSMSERLPPQEMLGILNRYFTRMSAIVEKHGGVVDKYMGDALMALFGAPLKNPDDADRAMKTALEMVAAIDELNRQWQIRGLPRVGLGIGVNTDIVVAGNMGSATRLNYTVIGDGVNLASRLEGLTKMPEYATRIIISGSTLASAKERYHTRRLGEVAVKGKQKATEIFALLGRE